MRALTSVAISGVTGIYVLLTCVLGSTPPPVWPTEVQAYRALLSNLSKNTSVWSTAARSLRTFMQANDKNYPLYHMTAPEGWNNDPNGVIFDRHTGLYHRFYQYDPTYADGRGHGEVARTWGQTVSRDLVHWEDWPGIYADTPWDEHGVFSGNCVFNGTDPRPICIYSNDPCSIGVCATSDDWVNWRKRACMTKPPSTKSQTNHDTSIWRDSDTGKWYLLIGGCTFNAPGSGLDPNVPTTPNAPCHGNAQLWTSSDLRPDFIGPSSNFTYVGPITPGGPGNYWELPYLLGFSANGTAVDDYHHEEATQYVLAFGHGNAYWVGTYNRDNHSFVPLPRVQAMRGWSHALPSALWSLNNGSADAGSPNTPNGHVVGQPFPVPTPGGIGALFWTHTSIQVPYFSSGLDVDNGFGWSVMVQLSTSWPRSTLFCRADIQWGVELWPGSVVNFYVRDTASRGDYYRGIQGLVDNSAGKWIRIAGSYNGSAPFQSNIQLYVDGAPITNKTTEAGTLHGPTHASGDHSGFTIGSGLDGIFMADVQLFSEPLAAGQLAVITSAPTPAPAPPAPPAPPPGPAPPSPNSWPPPFMSDTPAYYSINPHATDRRGQGGSVRRLVFGWIITKVTPAVSANLVPYWQSAHSLLRTMTVRGPYMVQQPAPEIEGLRQGEPHTVGSVVFQGTTQLQGLTGDALDITATFNLNKTNASAFGVIVRYETGGPAADAVTVTYTPASQTIMGSWFAGMAPQPGGIGTVQLRIFLDRSIVEVYCGGAVFTVASPILGNGTASTLGVALIATDGVAALDSLQAWRIGSMWGPVDKI